MVNTVMAYLGGIIAIALLYVIADRLGTLYHILNAGFTMLGDFITLYRSYNENEKGENDGT